MYKKPTLQQFGSFRELTKYGSSGSDDILSMIGIGDGCGKDTSDRGRGVDWYEACLGGPTVTAS